MKGQESVHGIEKMVYTECQEVMKVESTYLLEYAEKRKYIAQKEGYS